MRADMRLGAVQVGRLQVAALVMRVCREKCNNVLFEKTVSIEVLERDMPPVFDAYYGDPDNQRCKKCGHVNPGRPQKG